MLVSAVLDPSAFNAAHFNQAQGQLYKIQAEDFLKGIQRNGVLIVDPENKLRDALMKKIESIPIKHRQQLGILVTHLFQNEKRKRIIACSVSGKLIATMNLLDLAYYLKTKTEVDALIVGDDNFLYADSKSWADLVPLSEYRESDFEEVREKYETHNTPIDKLPKSKVKDFIIRSVRFSKRLRFYDPYIGRSGRRNNTRNFRKGIEYILSLWDEHGFFSHQTKTVEIFTCCDHRRWETLIRSQERRIDQELIQPLKDQFPCWSVEFSIKTDQNRIFHARYLETQHAIIRIERGFDLFKTNGEFRRNFFTLNMMESLHLRECRDLPDASV